MIDRNALALLALVTLVLQPARADEAAETCGADTVEWRRGVDVTFCAYVCSSDADCEQGIERCHLLDPEAGPADPPIFIDDNPEIIDVFAAEGKPTEGLCDPFFDFEGVVGAKVVAFVVEETPQLNMSLGAPTVEESEAVAAAARVVAAPAPTKKKTAKAAPLVLLQDGDGEGEGP